MDTSAKSYPYLRLDDRGVPWIEGTNTKVVEVVLDHLAHGLSAEEICMEHPHLSLSQIHTALAYYHDHRDTMDGEIETSLARARNLRSESLGHSLIRQRLARLGKLPSAESAE